MSTFLSSRSPALYMLLMSLLSTALHADVLDIDSTELQKLLDNGVPIVDVRLQSEWETTGVIQDSHLMTFFDDKGRYDAQTWQKQLDSIANQDEPVILICHSGQRSDVISRWLSDKQGYKTVYNVKRGIMAWRKTGGDTSPPQ